MTADLYCSQLGFSSRPFSLSPDPDLLFWTRAHKRAYSILEYGLVTKAPLTVVTGEVGTGKTTLVQALLRRIEADSIVGLISNAQGGARRPTALGAQRARHRCNRGRQLR